MTRIRSSRSAASVRRVALIVVTFVVLGLVCGWGWHHWWSPPLGVVIDGRWHTDELGTQELFSGTGLYAAIAVIAGLMLGVLCAALGDRAELETLGAVLVGSVLAGLVMWQLGVRLGPPDPGLAARLADDGTRLPGRLDVAGVSALGMLPLGALLGLAVVFLGFSHGHRRDHRPPSPPGSFGGSAGDPSVGEWRDLDRSTSAPVLREGD